VQINVRRILHVVLALNLLFTLGLVSLALNVTHPKADLPRLSSCAGFECNDLPMA
jgi:hypothetical protein